MVLIPPLINGVNAMTKRDIANAIALLKVLAAQEQVVPVKRSSVKVAGNSRKQAYRDAVFNGFRRRGLKLVFNPTTEKFDDVLPFKEWQKLGLVVRKGQKSVRGLFHKSQTEPLARSA